ncbi:hypothetical protein QTO34_013238 [Cnephaeus nilssonii]|uniref:C2H2-type domain-containing protein n=1 Tax=Cnephaeus nilssonii TaxID=3371016 RepID=A0AA40I8L2_CNENI|nr:hypothetical protein QTO34_013238 [Eptesicus nilssonii]
MLLPEGSPGHPQAGSHWEKPSQCPDCKSHFADPELLAIHQHKHTGEKPYSRPKCSLRFAYRYLSAGSPQVHTQARSPTPALTVASALPTLLLRHQHVHSSRVWGRLQAKYGLEDHQWVNPSDKSPSGSSL